MSLDFMDPESIEPAGARTAAALVSAAADLALVIDRSGIITDLSHNLDLRLDAGIRKWRGRPVVSVIEAGSRPNLDRALKRARDGRRTDRFEVNHVLDGGSELPVQYAAVGIGDVGRIVLVGRDLRAVSDLQSRLLDNRQSTENAARTQKQIEARYRLLFEASSDAIAFVDPDSGKVREINPRAGALVDASSAEATGKRFAVLFDKSDQSQVRTMLASVAASGAPGKLGVALPNGGSVMLAAELFRAGDLNLIIVRIFPDGGMPDDADPAAASGLDALARNASEAILLTDAEGSIIWANESFLVIAALPLAAHAVGKPAGDFFHWSSVERQTLYDNVRKHGRVPVFAGTVRGRNGEATEVDLSVVAMNDGSMSGYGFVMRPRGEDEPKHAGGNSDLTRTAENLAQMVGRVPMKDLVRDTTDVIERMCIEAALKLTGNNRASTARVLGLSRQALYLKMHRFGIADSD